ncbi:MAG: tetratricopeptide repeat protein, partial [Winogradskyella sp.]
MSFGQNNKVNNSLKETAFTLKGSVYQKETRKPYKNVSILVNGGSYSVTSLDGEFTVKAKIGDELIIRHSDFETVYYTITSNERVDIEVVDAITTSRISKKNNRTKRFISMIDSADSYLKKDAERSIKFIGDALNVNTTTSQSAEAHELLGDVYMYWKQYDLAISAYKTSIQNVNVASATLKLAKAYYNNNELKMSITTYNSINNKDLSNYEKAMLQEGKGDAYLKAKKPLEAITAYQDGLAVAEQHLIAPKITDLNSKIAQAYSEQGKKKKAKSYFSNSLNLAEKENKKRVVEAQIKVAEFNNINADYESEIALRKQAIKGIKAIETDSVIKNESSITLQKQNYKLGNAYLLQNDSKNAITYLEESIKVADIKEDLVVKKDATRRLSEVYFSTGETEKGIEKINEYKTVVDKLYAQKEQELSQAARFSKNIAEKQNRITSLESDRALSQSKYELTKERNKSQQVIIYSLIGGVLLLLVLGYLMFKYIRQQKLANNLLALKSLRSQMNPHFIFNALNSVNSFIA